ncbi:putative mucin/carbohydrate-binding domain-containing protein [Eubacterium multiforme]|uniref:Transglutaminase-like domain-containing protein n=1 Tax=Eubacterium multiforme TaxID=83339 RepID=A0ABT9UVJ7_9FIRM|nr:putative mucin/carbohydrate-binding domain-containing protein [Eubacterium multiforme]MDQ0150351.1 hypothetical protein [Eubacterium multiforme]
MKNKKIHSLIAAIVITVSLVSPNIKAFAADLNLKSNDNMLTNTTLVERNESSKEISLLGYQDKEYANIKFNLDEGKLILKTNNIQPHKFFGGATYVSVKILNENNNLVYEKSFIGDKSLKSSEKEFKIKPGYKLELTSKEPNRVKVLNSDRSLDKSVTIKSNNIFAITKGGLKEYNYKNKEFRFLGYEDKEYANIKFNLDEGNVILKTNNIQPHKFFGGATYVDIKILDENNNLVYKKNFIGDKFLKNEEKEFKIKPGYKLELRNREPNRVKIFDEDGNVNKSYKVSGKTSFEVTNNGLVDYDKSILDDITKPFPNNLYYGRSLLSEEGKKAWDLSLKTLLKYDNRANKYTKRDREGNVLVEINYEEHGIYPTVNDGMCIQKYLVRNEPRMFLLKDWGADIKKDKSQKVVVSQTFHIGNTAQNGDDYHKALLKIEPEVQRILSVINPNMTVYQKIKALQDSYEKSLRYSFEGSNSDIRGVFINHKAICGGYAKGFEYLLQRIGINNIWVNGYAGGPHAWNMVEISGKWYLMDTTWGGRNWYLRGAKDTSSRSVYDTFNPMPKLEENSISYELAEYNG